MNFGLDAGPVVSAHQFLRADIGVALRVVVDGPTQSQEGSPPLDLFGLNLDGDAEASGVKPFFRPGAVALPGHGPLGGTVAVLGYLQGEIVRAALGLAPFSAFAVFGIPNPGIGVAGSWFVEAQAFFETGVTFIQGQFFVAIERDSGNRFSPFHHLFNLLIRA